MERSARVLDGKALAKRVRAGIAAEVAELAPKVGRPPGLAVVLVGDDPASSTYVGMKGKAAKKCGFETFDARLPQSVSQDELLRVVGDLNGNDKVDGILVQLPLPDHIDQATVLNAIAPAKDADGLHPINQGSLLAGEQIVEPCTPKGVMLLVDEALREDKGESLPEPAHLAGKRAVVIGRSVLVGKPVAFMLLARHATVTIAHSRTANLPQLAAEADVLVVAVGRPEMVRGEWVKPSAVVIDVGINRTEEGSLVGDVAYDEAAQRAGAITPVPGGVGPMTVAMLMSNTLECYRRTNKV